MVMSGSYWEMALTQLIINLRYCLMSFSLAQKFRRDESLVHRYIAAFGVTDEIFGDQCQSARKSKRIFIIMVPCVWQSRDGYLEPWQEQFPEIFFRIL